MTTKAEPTHASACGIHFTGRCDCPVAEVERLKKRIAELEAELAARPPRPQ